MSNVPIGPQAGLAGQAEQDGLAAAASSCGKLLQSYGGPSTSLEQSKSARDDNAVYTDKINELVLMWLVEHLDIAASVCHTDSVAVFKDLLGMIASETPRLQRDETYYADVVSHLLEWFLEDIRSVARARRPDLLAGGRVENWVGLACRTDCPRTIS